MIRFKCIYCGQRILAREGGGGKKGKCPKCEHELVVPKSTKGRPAISVNKEPIPERPKQYIPAWEPRSSFDKKDAEEELIELFKEGFGFLIPTYDIMSLFLPAITWILLYAANSQMQEWVRNSIQNLRFGSEIFLIVFNPLLIFLAVVPLQVFMAGETIDLKKKVMMFFAVLINAGSGILVGVYVVSSTIKPDWLFIFPIWNIINCILLLLMLFFNLIDEECISDRKATFVQIILGIAAVVVIFLICNYVFKMHWAITFSICIVYTTSFDKALQSVFPRLAGSKEQ